MKKNTRVPRFEVDFKTRLAQRKAANDAVRLPRLGYALYRVYDIVKKKDKDALNGFYGSGSTGKSTVFKTFKSRYANYSSSIVLYKQIIEDLLEPTYKVKWLKPKHVTFLEMKGHRVEPTTADNKDHVNQESHKPVRLGA